MAKLRNFSDTFKAKVALEALRDDKTIQEIAAKYKVHPNQVSTWRQIRGADGSGGQGNARQDREAERRERFFSARAQEESDDPPGSSRSEHQSAM